jgi:cobalt-zinc-cadmium efflux system membrane fusion protein
MKSPLFLMLSASLAAADFHVISLPDGAVERLGLTIEVPLARPAADPVRATGQLIIDPVETAVIASRVSGQIEDDTLRPGDAVTKEQTILTLRSAELAGKVTTYLQAEQNLRFARTALEREKQLAERKLTTAEALQQSELAFQQAGTGHLSAIQAMYLLGYKESNLHTMVEEGLIRDDLTHYEVKSPVSGVIIRKATTPGAPVEVNQELLMIANLEHLLVEFQVPLRAVERVRPGLKLDFRTSAGTERRGRAEMLGMAPSAGMETLSATALARLDNAERQWIAGTPVEIDLFDPSAPEMPSVPVGSVVEVEGRTCVFVEEAAGSFRPVPVEVGFRGSRWTGIAAEPVKDRRVVTRGAALLLAAWEESGAE